MLYGSSNFECLKLTRDYESERVLNLTIINVKSEDRDIMAVYSTKNDTKCDGKVIKTDAERDWVF